MNSDNRKKMKEDFKQFIDSAAKVAEDLGNGIAKSAEKLVDDARNMKRQLVVSVRLDKEAVQRVEQLLMAGVFRSRSEAVAFLTREGIRSRQDLFVKIDEKIGDIRRIQQELRDSVKNNIHKQQNQPQSEQTPTDQAIIIPPPTPEIPAA